MPRQTIASPTKTSAVVVLLPEPGADRSDRYAYLAYCHRCTEREGFPDAAGAVYWAGAHRRRTDH